MKFCFNRLLILILAVIAMFSTVLGQDLGPILDSVSTDKMKFELEIQSDNDMYLMILQDQYYTNGLFINFRKKASSSVLSSRELNRIYTLSLGHKIYNPFTAQIEDISLMDRPFAGLFNISGFVQHHYRGDHVLQYGAEFGLIGPVAQGETLQNHLHTLLNMYHTAGWEYQIKNSFGVDFKGVYSGTLFRAGRWMDGSLQAEGVLGMHHIRGIGSGTLRIGMLNPFSSSEHFHARLQSREKSILKEFYFYGTAKAQAIAYDVTLQGGRFNKDKGLFTVEPNPTMYSGHSGLVIATRSFSFRAEYSMHTKESKVSRFRHQYGTVAVAVRF